MFKDATDSYVFLMTDAGLRWCLRTRRLSLDADNSGGGGGVVVEIDGVLPSAGGGPGEARFSARLLTAERQLRSVLRRFLAAPGTAAADRPAHHQNSLHYPQWRH